MWVAKKTGARLVGVDSSPIAIQRASERARLLGMEQRANFKQGTFDATGLESVSAHALMSVDALQYAPDVAAAFTEASRILRSGGRLAFVAFELDPERVTGLPNWIDPFRDYRPPLESAGFRIDRYEQLPNWTAQVSAGFGAVIDHREKLETELGAAAADAVVMEAILTMEIKPYCGHVFAVASRR